MPEPVIVDAVRTPIGRAFKGSLAALRPDETGAYLLDALLERNPGVAPETVEEVVAGCGLPQGLQAFNIGRIMVLLSEKLPDSVNGVTVSRYCASSLEAIRQAANAIKAGEGDAYIAAGVEWVSRYNERTEPAGAADQNEKLQGKDGTPNAYIEMGLTAVNVANRYEVSRADMDKYAQRSQELAVASQESGYFDREIVPVEVAGLLGGDGELLRALRVLVHVGAADLVAIGDVDGREPHLDVGVRRAVLALKLLVLVGGAGRLRALVVAAHPLDAGGDVGVALAG